MNSIRPAGAFRWPLPDTQSIGMQYQTSWGLLLASSGHSLYRYAVSDQLGRFVGQSVYGYAVLDQLGPFVALFGHSVYGYAVSDQLGRFVGLFWTLSLWVCSVRPVGAFCWPLLDTQSMGMQCQTSWGILLASSGHSVYGYAVSDQWGLLLASCGHSV